MKYERARVSCSVQGYVIMEPLGFNPIPKLTHPFVCNTNLERLGQTQVKVVNARRPAEGNRASFSSSPFMSK